MFAVSNNTINSPLQGTGKFFEWFNLGIDSLAIPSIKGLFKPGFRGVRPEMLKLILEDIDS